MFRRSTDRVFQVVQVVQKLNSTASEYARLMVEDVIFQQDGASCHTSKMSTEALREHETNSSIHPFKMALVRLWNNDSQRTNFWRYSKWFTELLNFRLRFQQTSRWTEHLRCYSYQLLFFYSWQTAVLDFFSAATKLSIIFQGIKRTIQKTTRSYVIMYV